MEQTIFLGSTGLESTRPGIDREAVLEVVGGDMALLAELAEIFLGTLNPYLTQIRAAATVRDAHALEQAAHALKGSVGNFCAPAAYEAAFRLEQIGRNADWSQIAAALAQLEAEMRCVVADLEAICAEASGLP